MATIVRSVGVYWMLLILYILNLYILFPHRMEKGVIIVAVMFGWIPSAIPALITGWTYGTYVGRLQARRVNLR